MEEKAVEDSFKKSPLLPNFLSFFRIPCACVIFVFTLFAQFSQARILFVIALFTDMVDGRVARHMGVMSRTGGFIDAGSDFVLVILSTLGLIVMGLFPAWLLYLELIMFTQFLLSARGLINIYDPLGKYFGGILMLGIGAVFCIPSSLTGDVMSILCLIYATASLVSRAWMLLNLKKDSAPRIQWIEEDVVPLLGVLDQILDPLIPQESI